MTATDTDAPPPPPDELADTPPPVRDLTPDELDQIEQANRPPATTTRRPAPADPVIPHDHQAEAEALGTALLNPDATTALLTLLQPTDHHRPAHQAVHQAIAELHEDGVIPTTVTIADHLGPKGLERIGGPPTLLAIQGAAVHVGALPATARIIARHARSRRLQAGAADLQDAIAADDAQAVSTAITALLDSAAQGQEAAASSWAAKDLTGLLTGGITRPTPQLLPLDGPEGHALLYPGKIHAFNAESESGKSWLAQWACAIEIANGHHTLYIDFEDDEAGVTDRLLDLGLDPADIVERFHYIRPDEPHDHQAAAAVQALLEQHQPTLTVLDGVTEALVMNGWEINSNDDAARFAVRILRPIADAGPAVVLIDHLPKDKDQQGTHAIGAQHKKAFITGAAYKLDVREPFGRGRRGKARITVTKDRPGVVRGWAVSGKVVGDFTLASTAAGDATVHLQAASENDPGTNPFRPTHLMETVSRQLEQAFAVGAEPSKNALQKMVPGQRKATFQAIDALIAEGHIEAVPGPNKSVGLRHRTPYREDTDPLSDRFDPDAGAPHPPPIDTDEEPF